MPAGYSGTPLARKLGIKPGFRIRTTNAPDHYAALVHPLPERVVVSARFTRDIQIWHFFTRSEAELRKSLPAMKKAIQPDGMIWISWPKKASRVTTDVTEDTVRQHALPLGLVDVKVCAVDEVWSGLKLVVRKELR